MLLDNYLNESYVSEEVTEESPYTLGLEGAMMHVYELECNYNKLMEAAETSEIEYYNQTGNSLFVNEAGAFGGFIEKAKEFFKKVIEKIKMIFNKFVSKIHSLVGSNKSFVKKYRTEILKKSGSIKDMDFNGYEFGDIEGITLVFPNASAFDVITSLNNINMKDNTVVRSTINVSHSQDSDAIDDIIEKQRALMINQTGALSGVKFSLIYYPL